MKTTTLALLALFTLISPSRAETASPYQGQQTRQIKALSAADIEAYLSGKGMGLAKAAELNHFPGPRHVLDLHAQLGLTREQHDRTQGLFDRMQQQASKIGQQIVTKEQLLDQQFANKTINPQQLDQLLKEIGALQARLRYIHLHTHLEQKAILSDKQIALYDRLRGYHSGHHQHHQHDH